MIKLILVILALMIVASLAVALVCAWCENRAWVDSFKNERDGDE